IAPCGNFTRRREKMGTVLRAWVLKGYARAGMVVPTRKLRTEPDKPVMHKGDVMLKNGWILAAALAAVLGTHQAFAAGAFSLTSSDFKDGERMPQKFAGNIKSNPNCVGENISPELTISNPPEGTKSFALLVFDPEGRPPGGVSHFVAYGIPPSVTSFAEGELSKPGDKFVGGQSLMRLATYFGPRTPPRAPPH